MKKTRYVNVLVTNDEQRLIYAVTNKEIREHLRYYKKTYYPIINNITGEIEERFEDRLWNIFSIEQFTWTEYKKWKETETIYFTDIVEEE